MLDLCRLIFGMVIDLLRSRVALEAEILVLRQQINVLRRTRPRMLTSMLVRCTLLAVKKQVRTAELSWMCHPFGPRRSVYRRLT